MSGHAHAHAGARASGGNAAATSSRANGGAGGKSAAHGSTLVDASYTTGDSPSAARVSASSRFPDTARREAAALRCLARVDPHGGAKVAQPGASLHSTLSDRLHAGTLLTCPDATSSGASPAVALHRLRKVAAQLAGAAAACHAAGFAHGALSPSVVRFEQPAPNAAAAAAQGVGLRLCGFGAAEASHRTPGAGDAAAEAEMALLRTPSVESKDPAVRRLLSDGAPYRPPESGEPVHPTAAADAWALGAIIAQCALGHAEGLRSEGVSAAELADTAAGVVAQLRAADGALGDLLAGLLCQDAAARMTPAAALRHPFLAPLGFTAAAGDARRAMPPPPPVERSTGHAAPASPPDGSLVDAHPASRDAAFEAGLGRTARRAEPHSPARPARSGDGDAATPAKSASAPPGSPLSLALGGSASAIAVVDGLLTRWEAAGLSPRSAARAAASRVPPPMALPPPASPPPPPVAKPAPPAVTVTAVADPPVVAKPPDKAPPPASGAKRGRPPGSDAERAAARRKSAPLPQLAAPRRQPAPPADDGSRARRERRKSDTPWWVVPKAEE